MIKIQLTVWTILLLETVAYPATTIRDEYFFENIWTGTLTLNTDSISVGIFDIRKLEEEDIQNDSVVYVPESMLKTLSHISIINREIKNIGDFNDNRYTCFIGKSGNRFESESVFIEIYNNSGFSETKSLFLINIVHSRITSVIKVWEYWESEDEITLLFTQKQGDVYSVKYRTIVSDIETDDENDATSFLFNFCIDDVGFIKKQ